MTTATQEIKVRIAKTIQDPQYEPLTMEVTIKETCPKKKYDERLDELINLASEKVFGYLGSGEDTPEEQDGFEEGDAETGEGDAETGEGDAETGEGGFDDDQGNEDFGEEGGEEGIDEEQEGTDEGYQDDEFGDFFEDDPSE